MIHGAPLSDYVRRTGSSEGASVIDSAHEDTFVWDHLPPRDLWPDFRYDLPDLQWQGRLNCADVLTGAAREAGYESRRCVTGDAESWSYGELADNVDRIAHVLVSDHGLRPGNRVLLYGYNSPMLMAAWFAVVKAGGVVVTGVAALRERELAGMVEVARPTIALCDHRLTERLRRVQEISDLPSLVSWGGEAAQLESRMQRHPRRFDAVGTAPDDPCLIAFTSGSTGRPKAAVHSHRAVLATCACFRGAALHPSPSDVFIGSSPIAFTFGLLGLICYPVYVGASVVLLERPNAQRLAAAVEQHRATMCFTVPTVYRQWLTLRLTEQLGSLRTVISSGEPLAGTTWEEFHAATGLEIVNVLGSTEMLHAYMSIGPFPARPGSVGQPIRGYQAALLDPDGQPVATGEVGELAVKGPTGCLYLDDPDQQRERVRGGWTLTGDLAWQDADGYYWLYGRADGLIVTSGYNVAPDEVEAALLEHPGVAEGLVTSEPDPARGRRLVAMVVARPDALTPDAGGAAAVIEQLRDRLAPYKLPRTIVFVRELPRTPTGKLQRRGTPDEVIARIDLAG